MDKKTKIIVGIVLAIVLIVGGALFYKRDRSNPDIKTEYEKCMEELEAKQKKNDAIIDKVDAEIFECIKEVLVREGYTDEFICMQEEDGSNHPICDEKVYTRLKLEEMGYTDGIFCIEDFTNPICTEERYQAEVDIGNESIERINVEIDAYEECGGDRDARLEAEGYEIIDPFGCMEYLDSEEKE